ncbi:MAG: acyltransferase family protein [Vicinamibacterales bacterium]
MMAPRNYHPVVDWLKVLGIVLILLGHLAGGYTNHLAPPVYPKQLGVAFFIFALGYSLSMETRARREVVFNRLFEVFLWGLAIAALFTLQAYVSRGTLALSNYLPFLLGGNLFLNNFPANPTTWYIGTYIHLLLLWCLARHLRISWPLLAIVLALEIACRYLLADRAGLFVAYMSLTNWITVLAAGVRAGQNDWSPRQPVALVLAGAIVFGAAEYYAIWPMIAERSFPFMITSARSSDLALLATSCLVSLQYLGWTGLTCLLFWKVAPPRWVRFVARNTLVIFIAHMPVFYWLDPPLQSLGLTSGYRAVIELAVCLPGLALVSEIVHRAAPIRRWRDALRAALVMRPPQPADLTS